MRVPPGGLYSIFFLKFLCFFFLFSFDDAECGDSKNKYSHQSYNGSSSLTAAAAVAAAAAAVSNAAANVTTSESKVSSVGLDLNLNNAACKWGRVGSHYLYGAASAAAAAEAGTDPVWPHPTQYYPYHPPYHHHHHHHHQTHQ